MILNDCSMATLKPSPHFGREEVNARTLANPDPYSCVTANSHLCNPFAFPAWASWRLVSWLTRNFRNGHNRKMIADLVGLSHPVNAALAVSFHRSPLMMASGLK